MKNYLIFSLLLCFNVFTYSQTKMKSGYFINNGGDKVECLIKNLDWLNSPIDFEYQLTPDSPLLKRTIQSTKEFGIADKLVYKRVTVDIDRSSALAGELSIERNPIFKKETLFLKVLVKGKASLYVYNDANLRRYFYSKDKDSFVQLVFKEYHVKNEIRKNNHYKQQLLLELSCEELTESDADINYHKSDLINYFQKYNKCQNSDYVSYNSEDNNKNTWCVNLKPGFNSTTFSLTSDAFDAKTVDFDSELSFRLGLEVECILGFLNNKWSFFVEPIYSSYSSEKEVTYKTGTLPALDVQKATVNFESIDLTVGIRHYMLLDDTSKLFLNAGFKLISLMDDSVIEFEKAFSDKPLISDNFFSFGLGYKYKNKLSAELRFDSAQDRILPESGSFSAELNNVSFILGVNVL